MGDEYNQTILQNKENDELSLYTEYVLIKNEDYMVWSSVVTHFCNPSVQEMEARGLIQVEDLPDL